MDFLKKHIEENYPDIRKDGRFVYTDRCNVFISFDQGNCKVYRYNEVDGSMTLKGYALTSETLDRLIKECNSRSPIKDIVNHVDKTLKIEVILNSLVHDALLSQGIEVSQMTNLTRVQSLIINATKQINNL
jgi:hypothetical protein